MKVTIGVLAHVDAGKTTFCEELLFETKNINQLGRVDHQNAFMDSHPIEKERGITIFADQAFINHGDHEIYLVDTPGHVDFSTEMERTLRIFDYAILIISAVDGVESHTETVYKLLEDYQIPTFIFINKMDRDGADFENVLKCIHKSLSKDVLDFTKGYSKDDFEENLKASLGEQSEKLLNYYLEEESDITLWKRECRKLMANRTLIPCFCGTALYQKGVKEFFAFIVDMVETNYKVSLPFSGKVYKIKYDEKGLKWTYIKVLSGRLRVKERFEFKTLEGQIIEKINEMKIVQGNQRIDIEQANAGALVAVTGISSLKIGDYFDKDEVKDKTVKSDKCDSSKKSEGVIKFEKHEKRGSDKSIEGYTLMPTLQARVIIDPSENKKWFYEQFQKLEDEDPSLGVKWQQETGEIIIQIMGEIQLEVLKNLFIRRFLKEIDFTEPSIIYKETIKSSVYGYGHFEPLKHYAEVHLKLEPNPPNTGITFKSNCHTDHLSYGNQNLVKTHILEREHRSLLTGSALTDVKIILLTGRVHDKHTHGGDFREATIRALRQGLEQAEVILLEPYYEFTIGANKTYLGKIMTDIQKACGTFDDPIIEEERFTISGRVPVSTFMKYTTTLAAMTSGTGRIRLISGGYDICHNTQEVIENIAYDKVTDKEYPSSSVFCAKGKGYTVPWNQAKEAMHCQYK
jgi:small GTP-binding protein